ncbi:hypothetical protein V5E97_14805 [Singulisphaera sp. Ch08]|uniref:Uncharacterized protein n=1 Tax=Singulisphaera sp. Ch08 TaxID=3120278 RepID=A0AAU7CPK3_9BACT
MRFSSQKMPDIDNASDALIERAFDGKAMGNFAHLWKSDDVFIQASCRAPSNCVPPDDPLVKEIGEFIQRTGSEPWTLEHVDGVARKEYRVEDDLTLEQVKTAFLEYLRSDGEWRQDHAWVEMDTRNNPFPNPMPDTAFELIEAIPNDALRNDHLPSPDAAGTEVWRLANTFNGFKHWGSFEQCEEIANQIRDSTLTELRTCLFYECRRWHYYGELPDKHESPYIRGLVEKIREMVVAGRVE